MNAHLFVYGTLLAAAGHAMGARLQRHARFLGSATIRGRLYCVGHYPGLVEAEDPHYFVHAEVYALDAPAVALRWLDAYEGIVPQRPAPRAPAVSPYERVERPVRMASGGTIDAWVY